MIAQFLRRCSVIVGDSAGNGLELSDMRVRFDVIRGDSQTPNSLDIRIYNLTPQTATSLQSKQQFSNIQLQAGYPGNIGLIFSGLIDQVRIGRENQLDSYVDITAADGDSAYNYSVMALSLAAGAKPQDSVQAFLTSMAKNAVVPGYVPNLSANGCTRGRVFYGLTRDEIRIFANNNNCVWTIDNGKLVFIPKQGYIPSGGVTIISPQTGLVGSPEQTENGIEMRVFLNPQIKIGQRIQLQDAVVNPLRYGLDLQSQVNNQLLSQTVKVSGAGTYYVMRAQHFGDTRGEEWFTDLVCLAVDATVPPSAIQNAAIAPSAVAIPLD